MDQESVEITDTIIMQLDHDKSPEDYLKESEGLSRHRILSHFGKINDVQLTRLGFTVHNKPFRRRVIIEYYWSVK
jgi:hypothetical protein